MLRYQLIESLPRIILYLYFCSLIDLAGLIRKAYREVFDRFVYDLVTLAVIIDPIGMAAIFAALSQSTPPGGRRAMAVRGTAIAAGICVAFAFGGEALLRAMGVSLAAFQAAGGALLFLLATDMVFAHESGLRQPTRAEANICVNEAAVIVAGFQYREIKDVSCLPDCFSRPVSEYAIYLNDFMMHRVRNELLAPFVARLPGTSDAPWIEEERARLIVVETVRRIVAAEYDEVWRKPKLAARCRAVQLFEQVSPAMAKAQAVLPLECAKQALKGFRGCLFPDLRVGSPCAAAAQATARSFRKRFGPGADRRIWEMAALILEEAILFGRNDGIDDLVAAAERLERAKVLTAPV